MGYICIQIYTVVASAWIKVRCKNEIVSPTVVPCNDKKNSADAIQEAMPMLFLYLEMWTFDTPD
jgi:hypothetical protein